MAVGIYKITNPKGAIYIGSSKDIYKRWQSYKRLDNVSQHKIHNSLNKYGVDNHIFEILEICEIDDLLNLERDYCLKFNVLDKCNLNLRIPKILDSVVNFSKETRLKMSIARLGKPSNKKGKKLSDETKLKISLSKKGIQSNSSLIVLNTSNGIFYNSITDAAISINMKRTTLNAMLLGKNKNRTNFIYAI